MSTAVAEKTDMTARIEALLALRREHPGRLSYLLAVNAFLKRGLPRLHLIAPAGWHRNCFNQIGGGRSSFRVRTRSNDEDILAVAFEGDRRFIQSGRVVGFMVARRLGFESKSKNLWGLDSVIPKWFPRRNPDIVIDIYTLDRAIEAVLRCPPAWLNRELIPQFSRSEAQLTELLATYRRHPDSLRWKTEYLP